MLISKKAQVKILFDANIICLIIDDFDFLIDSEFITFCNILYPLIKILFNTIKIISINYSYIKNM